tara:strand:- start:421 stop:858 length:438 start_codon:yes stop_codon:yes gene_type:complete
MTSTIGAIVVCVAGLLGETPPADAAGVVFPVVRLVPKTEIAAQPPRGWPADAWARRAGGRFTPGDIRRPRTARIEIADTISRDLDRMLAHEIAHFVLWANGREWRHYDDRGRLTRASQLIAWVVSRFRTWCGHALAAPLPERIAH